MRSILIGFLLCTVVLRLGYGQKVQPHRVIDSTAVWSKGEIVMADTKKLNGLVRYNKMTGLLQFEDSINSKSLTPASVLTFTFYDSLQQKQRKFISYGFESLKSIMDSLARVKGITPVKVKPKFFEILMEFPTFAVLISYGPVNVMMSNGSLGGINILTGTWIASGIRAPATTYSQSEMLYIFDKDGKVVPLLMAYHRERDSILIKGKYTTSFSKMTDIIIQRYTEPYFYQIDDYAFENKLSYEKTEDVLKMFEYYRTLIND